MLFEHVNDEIFTLAKALQEGRKYSTDEHLKGQLKVGEEVVIDELVYSLTQQDGTLTFDQRTVTGSKLRTFNVSNPVDIDRFRVLISGGDWPNLLGEFPIEVRLN